MFGMIIRGVRAAVTWTARVARRFIGIGSDNLPDVLTVFTVASRVCVVALGAIALLATIIPALSADPVAVRLLNASRSMWEAGTQVGYESRYSYNLPPRREEGRPYRGLGSGSGRSGDVFEMDEDDLPDRGGRGWG